MKGFQKVALAPGEVKTLTFSLTPRDLSFYDPILKDWVAEPGIFEILVGSSSRDIRAVARFTLHGEAPAPRPRLNADTHLSHILQDPRGRAVIERYLAQSVPMSELNRFADRLTLNRMSLSFMEILPPDLLATITAELAKID